MRRIGIGCGWRSVASRALVLGVLLGAGLACAPPWSARTLDAIQEVRIRKIALVHFRAVPQLEQGTDPGAVSEAASVVTSRVLPALTQLEPPFEVVGPEQIDQWRRGAGATIPEGALGAVLRETFGVDAVLSGTVRRYQQRRGGPNGIERPAGVWLLAELRAPSNRLLWRGVYEETQRSLSEDAGSFSRARERGFKWVTAEALVEYGARHLMADLVEGASWR